MVLREATNLMMRRIAVLTSGVEAPGMNAALRGATLAALERGVEAVGIRPGLGGAYEYRTLSARGTDGICQKGGSVLGVAPGRGLATDAGVTALLADLAREGVEGLIVVGDADALVLADAVTRAGFPANAVAASIENELLGTDMTIGADTALNIALKAIDRLGAGGGSARRTFVIEVGGRHSGYLAAMTAIACEADAIAIPEVETTPPQVADAVELAFRRGQTRVLVVVAEQAACTHAEIARYLTGTDLGYERPVTVLGHVQRNAEPTGLDRVLGMEAGACAVDALLRGEFGVLAGQINHDPCAAPLADVVGKRKPVNLRLVHLSRTAAL